MPNGILVRPIRPDDARSALEVHRAAVREIAAHDYPAEIIEQWAALPIIDETIKRFLENPDSEVRFVAELDGEIVGMAALVPFNQEIRACYVAPKAVRRGVGTALLREMEREAIKRGLPILRLDSSLTAQHFYAASGYEVRERGEHILQTGARMACVRMQKQVTK